MTEPDRTLPEPFVNAHTHLTGTGIPAEILALVSFTPGDVITSETEYFSAGYHASDTEKFSETALCALLEDPRCLAVGECGPDPFAAVDMEKQLNVFLHQALLAKEAGKALVVHCVRRFPEILSLRKKTDPGKKCPWLIHGFRANEEIGRALLKAECILSLSPTYLRHLETFPSWLPSDRFLLETDTESFCGLPELYEKTAQMLNMDLPALRKKLFRTFCDFASL